jgi:putative DNA primase/helicase
MNNNNQNLITNKQHFYNNVSEFFNNMFGAAIDNGYGEVEIRAIPQKGSPESFFSNNLGDITNTSLILCNKGYDVYFGVNPRVGGAGKKENVHYVTTLHVDIDYGIKGHKKASDYANYNDAYDAIQNFELPPTTVIHTGGGFHCYWVLNNPVCQKDVGVEAIESVNKALSRLLKGDNGPTHIATILRVPCTYNFKDPNNPRQVTIVKAGGPKYKIEDFQHMVATEKASIPENQPATEEQNAPDELPDNWDNDLMNLHVSDRIKNLILHGKDKNYPSRSEADMAVILALIHKGFGENEIKQIFQNYPIGEKYREHSNPDQYLKHSIKSAKDLSNLSEEEMADPLFISGAIIKDKSGNDKLDPINFEEYFAKKYRLKFLDNEKAFFQYNGKCYELCTEDNLNSNCQIELGVKRKLFTPKILKEFLHYSKGDIQCSTHNATVDQVKYLTLQNGLFDLDQGILVDHSPSIFTTNLLPYDYDPSAKCPLWLKYLDDVFMGNQDKIMIAQEAMGYVLLKKIPTPAIFFLLGTGSNGKSVFVNTITNLFGEENVSSISLSRLSQEYYTLGIFGKMANISSETPHAKMISTDNVKAAVAGDWIIGRDPYKRPVKFKPYAKHFIAMNQQPTTDDNTHGWYRRIYILKFERTFRQEEMDVFLTDKLTGELSGIFNWAFEGYKRLKDKNYVLHNGEALQEAKIDYQRGNSNAVSFILNKYIKVDSRAEYVLLKELYKQYCDYCEFNEESDILRKSDFKKTLSSMGYIIDNSTKEANNVCVFGIIGRV